MEKRKPTNRPDPEAEMEVDEEAYYALFPQEGASDDEWTPVNPAHVREVRLYRLDGAGRVHLDNYTPAELPDERAVRALHGGGKFEVIAIDGRPKKLGRVRARRVFALNGPPVEPKGPALAGQPATAGAPEDVPAWLKATLLAASTVLPPVLAYMKDSSNLSEQQRQSHQALLIEALKGDRAANTELLRALAAPREAPPPAAQAAPAGSSFASLKELVQCMKELGFKKEEPDFMEDMAKILLPVFAMRMGPAGPPPFSPGGAPQAMPAGTILN
jgi:hypothetical protein